MKLSSFVHRLTLTSTVFLAIAVASHAQNRIPAFAHPRPHYDDASVAKSTTPLQTWDGTFTYKGATNHFVMVGTDPSSTNVATTIPTYIIPVRFGIKGSNGKITYFDPLTQLLNGETAVQNVIKSPIFQNQDYTQGGTDLGDTQYEDAFQRGNFWTDVMTNSDYHVLLGAPTVLEEVTVIVPPSEGSIGTEFGITVAQVDYNWFTHEVAANLPKLKQVTPNSLPIIMAYNTYLTESIFIIGGYHNAEGSSQSPQTYAYFGYVTGNGNTLAFAQDVSALSHELGEWVDDPYVDNTQGACGGILEDGDPLENTTDYGDYTYTLNGFTYHLQDLVFLKYFGQTPSTSVNDWWSFQNYPFTQVCQAGQ